MTTRREGSRGEDSPSKNEAGSNETNPDSAMQQHIDIQFPYILIPSCDRFYRKLREVGTCDILNRHADLEGMDLSYVTLQLQLKLYTK